MTNIRTIETPGEKSRICGTILRALPQWFGVESAIQDYITQVSRMSFWANFDGDMATGFLAFKQHNPYTGEIYVMGILPDYSRQGLGRQLIATCEAHCFSVGTEFLTVKTLDSSRQSEAYDHTRAFYFALGFRPLEILPTIWGTDHPCLLLVKALQLPSDTK